MKKNQCGVVQRLFRLESDDDDFDERPNCRLMKKKPVKSQGSRTKLGTSPKRAHNKAEQNEEKPSQKKP